VICVERDQNTFKVKVSDPGFGRYLVKAGSPQEAATAILHYYNQEHERGSETCPMCRQVAKDQGSSPTEPTRAR
jgi:hypothetical protein